MAKYHHYELASAAFQVGIVLASAAVITSIVLLAWFAGLLGLIGLGLLLLGLFAPQAVPLIASLYVAKASRHRATTLGKTAFSECRHRENGSNLD